MFRFAQHDSAICETSSTHTKIDLDIFAEIIADFHHVQFIASSDRFGSSYATRGTSSRLLRRGRETQPVFIARIWRLRTTELDRLLQIFSVSVRSPW